MIPFDYERASDADSAVATVARRPGAVFLGKDLPVAGEEERPWAS